MISNKGKKFIELKQNTSADKRQLGPIVQFDDAGEMTSGQTEVALTFAVPIKNKKLFWFFVDGEKLTEGADGNFELIEIQNGTSAKIRLAASQAAGSSWEAYLVGTRIAPFPSPQTVQAQLSNDVAQPKDWAENGFVDSVKVEEYEVPYGNFANIGAISGRAKLNDSSKMLTPLGGIERIPFDSVSLLNDEFGPTGETVYEIANKDSRMRFVGSWFTSDPGDGNYLATPPSGSEYLEVTFFGTGLNLLAYMDISANQDWRVTVDNGTEGSDIYDTVSNILSGRNYKTNQLLPVVSNLTQGWHTVKIRNAGSGGDGLSLYGCEIVNENSQLKITQGKGWSGCTRQELAALSSIDYKPTLMTGVKGGRVVSYIKDGIIGQVFTECPSSPAYLALADHSNEEVIRKIHWREFGANRSDDFSTLSTTLTDRAFTLDDGTTTLSGYRVSQHYSGEDAFYVAGSQEYFTLTFIGTGLNVTCYDNGTGLTETYMPNIYVDGVLQGVMNTLARGSDLVTYSICSGLSYGTHTIKFFIPATQVQFSRFFRDFIIYQPKKPVLPVGAVEVADYNVMADYIAPTGTGTSDWMQVPQGTLGKSPVREFAYTGTFAPALIRPNYTFGWQIYNLTTCGAKYTFYGTGISMLLAAETTTDDWTIKIDGTLNADGTDLVNTTNQGGGTYRGNTTAYTPNRIVFKDLPLGVHTIEIDWASGYFEVIGAFIITPIHVNNTKVGSLALNDSRNFSPIPKDLVHSSLGEAKAQLVYDLVNNKIILSNNISQVIHIGTGLFLVYFKTPFKNNTYLMASSTLADYLVNISAVGGIPVQFNNYVQICCYSSGSATGNLQYNSMVFFGELENEN